MSTGVLGDIKQQLGDLGKQVGQTVAQAPKATAKAIASQIGFEVKEGQQKTPPEMAEKTKKENADFVKELYGASSSQKPKPEQTNNPQQQLATNMTAANPEKTPEELQKMISLRQQLHGEYYQKLTTAQKRPEEAQEDQERAAERVERLGMEDLQETQKKKEKAKPLPQEAKKTEAPMGAG